MKRTFTTAIALSSLQAYHKSYASTWRQLDILASDEQLNVNKVMTALGASQNELYLPSYLYQEPARCIFRDSQATKLEKTLSRASYSLYSMSEGDSMLSLGPIELDFDSYWITVVVNESQVRGWDTLVAD